MNKLVFAYVLSSVLMSSVAQVVLKAGMSRPDVVAQVSGGASWQLVRAVAGSVPVWAGLALYFASALVWLMVLARVQVSLAYPFVGLGFVVTMLLGWLVQGDVLSPARLAGTLIIATGVVVLARS